MSERLNKIWCRAKDKLVEIIFYSVLAVLGYLAVDKLSSINNNFEKLNAEIKSIQDTDMHQSIDIEKIKLVIGLGNENFRIPERR